MPEEPRFALEVFVKGGFHFVALRDVRETNVADEAYAIGHGGAWTPGNRVYYPPHQIRYIRVIPAKAKGDGHATP